jgi:uncharacterized DUF497 family protein
MDIEFDAAKDAGNQDKHGISLAHAADLDVVAVVEDNRFAGERRFRLYGLIDGQQYCLAAVFRGGVVRAISLRRAHDREYQRHG